MSDLEEIVELKQEYHDLLHAMQSDVKFEQEWGVSDAQSPKHLRVGVNSAIVQSSGLARVLVDKGIITWLEYWTAQVEAYRREVVSYEERLSAHAGSEVHLR